LLAADQLYRHWDQLMGLMGVGFPQPTLKGPELLAANLKKATEEMEELAKKTRLAWYEVEKLAKLKDQVKSLTAEQETQKRVESALDSSESEIEQKSGAAFKKAVDESGGKKAFEDYRDKLAEEKDAKGMVEDPTTGHMVTPDAAARNAFDAAMRGDRGAREKIRKSMGNTEFARKIGGYSYDLDGAKAREADRTNAALDAEEAADNDRRNRAKGANVRRFGNQVLADIGMGKQTDKAALTGRIAGSMRASGQSEADIAKYAGLFAEDVISSVRGEVRETAEAEGIGKEQGATRVLAGRATGAQQAAGRGMGNVSDLIGRYHSFQEAYNKRQADPLAAETAANTRMIAQNTLNTYNEVKKQQKTDKGGLAGPK
jgi:hypothetical protein